MTPDKILAYLQEAPQDGELTCAVHGPLAGLRALPQAFRGAAAKDEEDPDTWNILADYFEAQLEDSADLTGESLETLTLEFDMTEDLRYALAIAQTRPELEIAITMVMPSDEDETSNYYAWYSPSGSNLITPTNSPKSWEKPFMADVRRKDEGGTLHTGSWGFPEHVLPWFPVEDICSEAPSLDK